MNHREGQISISALAAGFALGGISDYTHWWQFLIVVVMVVSFLWVAFSRRFK